MPRRSSVSFASLRNAPGSLVPDGACCGVRHDTNVVAASTAAANWNVGLICLLCVADLPCLAARRGDARHRDAERASGWTRRLERQPAAVGFDGPFGNRQAESGAADPRSFIGSVETVEDVRACGLGNA